MIDGHMHLENGPLTKEYVLEFVEEAHKKGIHTALLSLNLFIWNLRIMRSKKHG